MLRHIVLFKFRDSSPPEAVAAVVAAFAGLYGQVPQIAAFEWGLEESPERLARGFTHCFQLSYRSWEDLAEYQAHPAHLAFQEVLRPHLEEVMVVDYEVRGAAALTA
ncbi:MAG: Dabb family protein [Bacteroidia bacterium]|nr:Dabb family protein [Bacteroidia bacterium]